MEFGRRALNSLWALPAPAAVAVLALASLLAGIGGRVGIQLLLAIDPPTDGDAAWVGVSFLGAFFLAPAFGYAALHAALPQPFHHRLLMALVMVVVPGVLSAAIFFEPDLSPFTLGLAVAGVNLPFALVVSPFLFPNRRAAFPMLLLLLAGIVAIPMLLVFAGLFFAVYGGAGDAAQVMASDLEGRMLGLGSVAGMFVVGAGTAAALALLRGGRKRHDVTAPDSAPDLLFAHGDITAEARGRWRRSEAEFEKAAKAAFEVEIDASITADHGRSLRVVGRICAGVALIALVLLVVGALRCEAFPGCWQDLAAGEEMLLVGPGFGLVAFTSAVMLAAGKNMERIAETRIQEASARIQQASEEFESTKLAVLEEVRARMRTGIPRHP